MTLFKKEEFRACADIKISHHANTEDKKRTKGSFWNQRNRNAIERPSERRKDSKDFSLDSAKPDGYRYSLKGKNSYSFFSFDISPNSDDNVEDVQLKDTKLKDTINRKKVLNTNR